MARVDLPASKLRARRRTRTVRLILLTFGFLMLVGIGTMSLAYAPFWRIQQVVVVGNESIATSTIEAFIKERLKGSYAYVLPKDNILLYPKSSLRAELLMRFPALRSVVLRAENFSTLGVEVGERKPHALWCGENRSTGDACVLLDDAGIAYGSAVSFAGSAYLHYYGKSETVGSARQYLTEDTFRAVDAMALAMANDIPEDTLMYITVDAQKDVRMGFESGFVVIFPLAEDGATILQRLKLARSADPFIEHKLSDFEYLDLRFGDKLYYKLKGQ